MKKLFILLFTLMFINPAFAIDTGTRTIENDNDNIKAPEYSIKFGNASLKQVLRFLANIAKQNIILPEDIEGSVNVDFEDIRIQDAMHSIIKANGLDYAQELGIIRVGKGDKFAGTGEDLKTETFRLQYASAKELKEEVKGLLTDRGSVFADERTNSLVIRDMVSSIENVRGLVDNVDIKDAQVLIEAKIIEATRDFTRNLGIQWFGARTGGKVQMGGIENLGTVTGIDGTEYGLLTNFPASDMTSALGVQIGTISGVDVGAILSAAEERGDLEIISEPSIVTSNGKQAKIRSGETLLVATSGGVTVSSGASSSGSSGSGGEVEEIETGVELEVTPQISANNFIRMDIKAETSQADFSRAVEGLPVIVDNTASTSVMVKDGETTIIGGLFKYKDAQTRKGVPFLSKIPLLGVLFRSKEFARSNTDLMLFIKPSIVRDVSQVPVQARINKIEELKRKIILPNMYEEEVDKEQKKKYKDALKQEMREAEGSEKPRVKTKKAHKAGNRYSRYR